MNKLLCRLVVALVTASLVACTSLRTVVDTNSPQAASASSESPLAPGDVVTVATTTGALTRLLISAATATSIDGTQVDSKQAVHIQLADITKIERREFSGIKTLLLVVAICAVLYAMTVAAAEAALASNI